MTAPRWAMERADELFERAREYAENSAPGGDLSAGIDRLGCRLLFFRDAIPQAIADAHREGWQAAIEAAAQYHKAGARFHDSRPWPYGGSSEAANRHDMAAKDIRALPYQPPEDRGNEGSRG